MSTKLYVGNLPFQTTEADLQALFESSGAVASVSIVRDRATGQARGFGFVEMADAAAAQQAIKDLNSQEYGGRALTVNEAKPMAPRGSGGGGFGGGRGNGGGGGGFGGGGGGRQRREPRW
jgi:cold-inducible RNA-binding protein